MSWGIRRCFHRLGGPLEDGLGQFSVRQNALRDASSVCLHTHTIDRIGAAHDLDDGGGPVRRHCVFRMDGGLFGEEDLSDRMAAFGFCRPVLLSAGKISTARGFLRILRKRGGSCSSVLNPCLAKMVCTGESPRTTSLAVRPRKSRAIRASFACRPWRRRPEGEWVFASRPRACT